MGETPLRLLLASCTPRSRATGMGAWAFAVADALRRLGHHPTLWFDEDIISSRAGRVTFLVAPLAARRRLRLAADAFDAVVLHEPLAYWYARARRHDLRLPPLVVMCHNVESKVATVMAEAERAGRARRTPWAPLTTRLLRHPQSDGAIRLGDAVICLSTEDRDYIRSTLRVPAARIFTMANGVDQALVRDRQPPSGPATRVLFVGGWQDVKGRRVLPDLWREVRRARPEARLTLLGVGVDAGAVTDAFVADDRDSLEVVPRLVEPSVIADAMDRHDLLLMPSLSEGSPLTLLEALAAGLPVVASARGGIRDLITDGIEGRLFDPLAPASGAAAVLALLGDAAALRRCGDAAHARARVLTWDAAAAQLLGAVVAARRIAIR